MKEYTVEMCYSVGVSIECIEANSEEEAIQKARKMMEENPGAHVNLNELSFDGLNYVGED